MHIQRPRACTYSRFPNPYERTTRIGHDEDIKGQHKDNWTCTSQQTYAHTTTKTYHKQHGNYECVEWWIQVKGKHLARTTPCMYLSSFSVRTHALRALDANNVKTNVHSVDMFWFANVRMNVAITCTYVDVFHQQNPHINAKAPKDTTGDDATNSETRQELNPNNSGRKSLDSNVAINANRRTR